MHTRNEKQHGLAAVLKGSETLKTTSSQVKDRSKQLEPVSVEEKKTKPARKLTKKELEQKKQGDLSIQKNKKRKKGTQQDTIELRKNYGMKSLTPAESETLVSTFPTSQKTDQELITETHKLVGRQPSSAQHQAIIQEIASKSPFKKNQPKASSNTCGCFASFFSCLGKKKKEKPSIEIEKKFLIT